MKKILVTGGAGFIGSHLVKMHLDRGDQVRVLTRNKCLLIKKKIILVDFKIEFGRLTSNPKKIVLADEISPDSCRLWDKRSKKKLDKDVFRKNLGNLLKAYEEVASRLGIVH